MPHPLLEVAVVVGEVAGVEAPAFFDDQDPVALFGQPERGDAAPEPGADDDIVVLHEADYRPNQGPWPARVDNNPYAMSAP